MDDEGARIRRTEKRGNMTDRPFNEDDEDFTESGEEPDIDERIDDLGASPDPDGVGSMVAAINRRPGGGAIEKPPKSLPVLAAFQEFLDDERKRSRNRMLILSGFFLIIIISVVTCGTLVGMLVYKDVQADYSRMQSDVLQLEKDANEGKLRLTKDLTYLKSSTEHTLDTYASRQKEAIGEAMAAARTEAQQHQERVIEQVRTEMAKTPADVEKALAGVKDVVQTLESENTKLKKEIEKLKSGLPTIDAKLQTAMARIQNLSGRPQLLPVEVPPRAAMPVDTVSFSIQPGNRTERFSWRLPIPE